MAYPPHYPKLTCREGCLDLSYSYLKCFLYLTHRLTVPTCAECCRIEEFASDTRCPRQYATVSVAAYPLAKRNPFV